MCRLNLDERLVRIDEQNAALFIAAFDRATAEADLTADTRAKLRFLMAVELRKCT